LIGGIQYVTLSDDEAKRRGTQKSILERKAYPTFEIVIEINTPNSWTIHQDVETSVDLFLRGLSTINQVRQFSLAEKIQVKCQKFQNLPLTNPRNKSFNLVQKNWSLMNQPKDQKSFQLRSKTLVIYPYSLSHNLLKEALFKMGIKFVLTNDIKKASLIIGLKKHFKQNFQLKNLAKEKNIPIYTLNQLSFYQLTKFIQFLNI